MPSAEYRDPILSDTLQSHYRLSDQIKLLQQEVLYLKGHSRDLERKNLVLETQCDMLR
jgi:hypothetical protein